jgi:UPF0042 nucleotide-binding protein
VLDKIVSFGFKHGAPPKHTDHVVVDVRRLFRNPYVDVRLRQRDGLDRDVQEYIKSTPNFDPLYQHLKQQVTVPGIRVAYIGCIGGKHRSVFLAERLAKDLGVQVEHRDLTTP